MRIPAGAEFNNPAESNHFSNVFVFHRESRTVHNDDTILFAVKPRALVSALGHRDGVMSFHPTIKSVGLLPTATAAYEFWNRESMDGWMVVPGLPVNGM